MEESLAGEENREHGWGGVGIIVFNKVLRDGFTEEMTKDCKRYGNGRCKGPEAGWSTSQGLREHKG